MGWFTISRNKALGLVVCVGMGLCLFLLLGRALVTQSVIGGDAVYYYMNVHSLVDDHDLNFNNEAEYFYNNISPFTKNRKLDPMPKIVPATGLLSNKYPVGTAILLLPFYAAGRLVDNIFMVVGGGYSLVQQCITASGSIVYALCGLLLIYFFGTRIFPKREAAIGTLGVTFATPLIYYMTMEPLMAHAMSMFVVSAFLFVWYFTRENRQIWQWVSLGLLAGLMAMVRYPDAVFALVPIFDAFWRGKMGSRRWERLDGLAVYLACALLAFSPQLYANQVLYGNPFITGYQGEGFPYFLCPKLVFTLFSFDSGLLVWSPIIIFSIVGLFQYWCRERIVGFWFLTMGFAQWYLVSSWSDYGQGDSFGGRMFLNLTLIFAVGLMQWLDTFRLRPKIYWASVMVFILLAVLNAALAGLYCLRIVGQPY